MADITRDFTARVQLRTLAEDLRSSLLAETPPDEALIARVKHVVQIHSLYVQLLSISIAMERLDEIPEYLALMDTIRDTIEEDIAALKPDGAVRALHTMGATVQNTYQIIRDMTTTQEASSVLLASFLKLVQVGEEETGGIAEKLKKLTPVEKRKLVAAAEQLLQNVRTDQQQDEEHGE